MMPQKERNKIQKAIENKDFDSFIEYYKKYNSQGLLNGYYDEELNSFITITYLPDLAIEDKTNNYINILNKENFKKITYSEYECG